QSLDGAWIRVNGDPIAMGSGGEFRLHDGGVTAGEVFYRLAALLPGGSEQVASNTQLVFGGRPFTFAATSNPFTGHTTLRYALPRSEHVRIGVYTVTGQLVRTLVDRTDTPGDHAVEFALREGGRAI